VSLRTCCWWAEKLPDNVTCGEGCEQFPACLPTLEMVRKLTERRQEDQAPGLPGPVFSLIHGQASSGGTRS
jgi:hypothetical protein